MVPFNCPFPPVPFGTVFSVSSRLIREWILSKGNTVFVFLSMAIAQSWEWVKWLHTVLKIQRRQEWGNVSKMHTIQAWGPEFVLQKPLKSRHGGGHICQPRAGEEESGGSPGLVRYYCWWVVCLWGLHSPPFYIFPSLKDATVSLVYHGMRMVLASMLVTS